MADTKLPKFAKKCKKAVRKFKVEVYKNVLIDKEMSECIRMNERVLLSKVQSTGRRSV